MEVDVGSHPCALALSESSSSGSDVKGYNLEQFAVYRSRLKVGLLSYLRLLPQILGFVLCVQPLSQTRNSLINF